MLYFSLFHLLLQNFTKFCGNIEIPQNQANSMALLKICIVRKTVVPNYVFVSVCWFLGLFVCNCK